METHKILRIDFRYLAYHSTEEVTCILGIKDGREINEGDLVYIDDEKSDRFVVVDICEIKDAFVRVIHMCLTSVSSSY